MPTKVVHLPDVGEIIFSQNQRSTRLKLSVKPNLAVQVSFPPYVSFQEATRFVMKQMNWIAVQQQKMKNRFIERSVNFPLKTRFHHVNIQPDGDKFSVKQKKFEITIFYPSALTPNDAMVQSHIARVVDGVYRWEAKRYLPQRLQHLAVIHNLPFNKVTIRCNSSNWGSCSSKNNISLNARLMKMPDHLIDFIMLHELAHTRVKNHGPEFWKLLDNLTNGSAKRLTSEVKKFSTI